MVEANGGSYSQYNWVSAHTGIPTLLGWGGHELQWRGNYDEPGKREPVISEIYTSLDMAHTRELLNQYDIDYVYVGQLERDKFRIGQQVLTKFDHLLQRVYESPNVIIYGMAD